MTGQEVIDFLKEDLSEMYTDWEKASRPYYEYAIKAIMFIEENYPKTFQDYLRGIKT